MPRPSIDITRSQSSAVDSVIAPSGITPAFATRTSIRPNCSTQASIIRRASASFETSPTTVAHAAPFASRSALSRASPSASTSVATTRAPSAAKTSAVARPMPFAAPVMTADFPASRVTAWPDRGLLGVLDRARLADDRDLDLARVGQLLLDLADDVAGEPRRGQVVDLLGPDEDPDLAAGLDGERALDARRSCRRSPGGPRAA